MKKQIIAAITTHPVRAAFLLILLFLLGSVMHEALGQGNTGKRSVAATISQVALPASGAVSATYAPTPNIPAMDQSQLVAPAVPSSAWTVATPYPIPVVRYGFAQTATHFYLFGGVSNGTRVPDVNRMVLATGMWESRAPMPFTSEAPTCALMASTGIVYCTEGDTGSGFASYNIATNTWTPLANIPGGDHYGSASGAFNGKVFVAGGTTGQVNLVQVYTVSTNTWSGGTAAPNDFLLAGYQQVGQYLYVVGGFSAAGPVHVGAEQSSVLRKGLLNQPAVPWANNATTLRLDMSSAPGVWSTGPAFAQGRADFGLAYDAGTNKLYALGGDATGNGFFDSTNLVDELSVASWPGGSWAASPDNLILPNRQGNQTGFYGAGQIWSVGGIEGQTFQFLAEVQRRTNGPGSACQYTIGQIGGSIVPGTTDIGNHGDDTVTTIALPFPYTLYDQTFTSINLSSNGNAQFTTTDATFTNQCLPWLTHSYSIFPHWDDLYLVNSGFGIFTSISGTAPNRIFNIEWRAQYFPGSGTANFELRLYEGQGRFDIIYGTLTNGNTSATAGVQKDDTTFTQYFCNGVGGAATGGQSYILQCGGGTCTRAWQNEPPMANARRNPATVAVGSNLYAITGFNAAPDYTAVNERFNGTTWTALAPIPVPHAQSRGAAVGTSIYVPGGFNSVSFGGPLDTMQIYNTTTNTWSAGMTMPGTRGGPATAAFNGLVYVIAGYTTPFPTGTNTVFIYNPGTNSYTTGAPMPAVQGNVPGVLYNGEIYVVGGGASPGAQYAYNPTTNSWRTIAPLPTTGGTCQSGNGFVLDNEVWVVGCLGLPINQQVWIYNPGGNTWRAGPQYTVDHQGPGAALFNGRGFAVGGGTAGGGSTAVESIRSCTPVPSSAVSRKVHGAFTGDIDLPLVAIGGAVGIECRNGTGVYQMVVTFPNPVTVGGVSVTSGTGSVGSSSVSGGVVTINLTGVTDAQRLGVTLANVNDGTSTGDVLVPMGVLIGDSAGTGNGSVNAGDVGFVKSVSGQTAGAGNFRADVAINGTINASDVGLVKANSGHLLPP